MRRMICFYLIDIPVLFRVIISFSSHKEKNQRNPCIRLIDNGHEAAQGRPKGHELHTESCLHTKVKYIIISLSDETI